MKNAATIDKGSRPTFGWLLLLVQVILSSADNNEVLQCWRSELRHWARLDSTHSTRLLDSRDSFDCAVKMISARARGFAACDFALATSALRSSHFYSGVEDWPPSGPSPLPLR